MSENEKWAWFTDDDPSPALFRPEPSTSKADSQGLRLDIIPAGAAKTPNVTASLPDEVPSDVRFAAIYSNPPVRVGKAPLHELLLRWLPRLDEGARAYLVVQRNLGSDSLAAWLATQGYNVKRLRSKKGYRILEIKSQS